MRPRQTSVSVLYNGVNASGQIAPYLTSFQYVDVASGASDRISLQLSDRDYKWIGAWFPQKGDLLRPSIHTVNWDGTDRERKFSCGTFRVDDFSFGGIGGPISPQIEALAIPADNSGFKATARTETYERTTLMELGQIIAARAGIELFFGADDIRVGRVEQNNQNDCEFYCGLVEKYGLAVKIYNDKLVVFSEADYEAKKPKLTLTPADFEPGGSWNTKTTGTYTGVRYQYTNSSKNQTFTVSAGGGNRILECNEPAEDLTEATIIALAAVNKANRGTTTMNVTIKARPGLIATDCVEIAELGRLSGKYYIEQITHSPGDSGYKMALSLRLVEPPITETTAASVTFGKVDEWEDEETPSEPTEPSEPSEPEEPTYNIGDRYTLTEDKKGYYTALEALQGAPVDGHPTGMCHPGTYWIFNISQGMLNLSTVKTVPGNWINPN